MRVWVLIVPFGVGGAWACAATKPTLVGNKAKVATAAAISSQVKNRFSEAGNSRWIIELVNGCTVLPGVYFEVDCQFAGNDRVGIAII